MSNPRGSLQRDLGAARTYLEQSLTQYVELHEPAGVLRALGSAVLARESLAGYSEAGDRHGMAAPLERLSEIAYRGGDLQASRGNIEEALGLVRGTCLLSDLAQVMSAQGGDPAAVRGLLAERDRLRVELGLPGRDPWTV